MTVFKESTALSEKRPTKLDKKSYAPTEQNTFCLFPGDVFSMPNMFDQNGFSCYKANIFYSN
ncbi:hypothetical protein Pan241w_26260 [Gimesia alba]|uniref:Uncharacterized protein n=1 Tax=Gimesia alba TaxID=2527973 RepID=A0A517RF86_9PLAN|nr:hypothetical protein Pan241w_26260 [Gimesia alba]